MPLAEKTCLVACGSFFVVALLTGVWKWRAMATSAEHRAPFYVDTAHRAALMYSFACLVLRAFAAESAFAPEVNTAAAAVPIFFFAVAVATYVALGIRNDTDNQFERPSAAQHLAMVALIVGELGGFSVLFAGFLARHVF